MNRISMLADPFSNAAALRVQGNGLDFDELSLLIGAPNPSILRKGSLSKSGRQHDIDTWTFESTISRDEPIESHLSWIADQLPRSGVIESVRNTAGVDNLDMFCSITVPPRGSGIHLSSEILARYRMLGVDLEISVVFVSPEVSRQAQESIAVPSPRPTLTTTREVVRTALFAEFAETLEPFSNDLKSLFARTHAAGVSGHMEWSIRTGVRENISITAQCEELRKALQKDAATLVRMSQPDTISLCSRFETSCEWGGFRLSQAFFELTGMFNCSSRHELVLI